MNRSDDAITGDVIAALGASPRVHAAELFVRTKSGWVRLEGVVGTLEEKEAAEQIAADVARVAGVENDLVISADRDVSDLQIAEELTARLNADPDLTGIGAKVNGGTAFLMGKVPSLAVKSKAIDVAGGVKGVRQVISELGIAAGEPVDDITLANDVAEALSDDPEIDLLDLDVKAVDGSVLITGEVPSERHLDLISRRAAAVPGVQYLENRVKVRGRAF